MSTDSPHSSPQFHCHKNDRISLQCRFMRHLDFAVLGIVVLAIGVFLTAIDDVSALFRQPVCITILMSAIVSGLLCYRQDLLQQAGVEFQKTCSDLSEIVQQFWQSDRSTAAQRNRVLRNGYLPTHRSLYTNPQVVQQYGYLSRMLPVAEEPLQSRQCAMRHNKTRTLLNRYSASPS